MNMSQIQVPIQKAQAWWTNSEGATRRRLVTAGLVVAVLATAALVVGLGFERGSDGQFAFHVGLFRAKELQGQIAQRDQQIQALTQERDQLKRQLDLSIPLASLPAPARAQTPQQAIEKISLAMARTPGIEAPIVDDAVVAIDRLITSKRPLNPQKMGQRNTETDRQYLLALQRSLAKAGAHQGVIDGNAAAVHNAVIQFQKQSKLKADGIVGLRTWGALKAAMQRDTRVQMVSR
jgi:murein L,D-transpeptidase YcbB/YkuD